MLGNTAGGGAGPGGALTSPSAPSKCNFLLQAGEGLGHRTLPFRSPPALLPHPDPLHLGWAPGAPRAPSLFHPLSQPLALLRFKPNQSTSSVGKFEDSGSSLSSTLPSWGPEREWRKGRGESTCRCYCPARPAGSQEKLRWGRGAQVASPLPSRHIPGPACLSGRGSPGRGLSAPLPQARLELLDSRLDFCACAMCHGSRGTRAPLPTPPPSAF